MLKKYRCRDTACRVPTIWIGFLSLPFLGFEDAFFLTAFLFVSGFAISESIRFVNSPLFQERYIYFRAKYLSLLKTFFIYRNNSNGIPFIPLILILLTFLFVPLFLNNYHLDILILAGIYIVLASGLNIVVGLAGLLDLGYISFYAVGAYLYALLSTNFDLSFWIALPIGGAAASLFGIMLGLVTLRLKGDYLAIVTLGFVQIIHLILNNWDSLTNGPNGILGIKPPRIGSFVFNKPLHFYYLITIIGIFTIFAVHRLNNSRVGRAWIAIREDEIAAQAMGINTVRMKILAFALGATLAGIAGVFFAAKFSFISPESFTFSESVIVLSMVVLGGMGSIPGMVIGATTLIILPELLRGFQNYRMLFFGLALVMMMIFRPQGLIGNPRRKIELGKEEK